MRDRLIRVLVCDDTDFAAESLRRIVQSDATFEWSGWLSSAAALPDAVADRRPDVVLLELDIPGEDAFDALRRVVASSRESRVVIYSGYVRKALIDRAIAEGAAGYASKDEPLDVIIGLVRRVARGETVLSRSALAEHARSDPAELLRARPPLVLHAPPDVTVLPQPPPSMLHDGATPLPRPPPPAGPAR